MFSLKKANELKDMEAPMQRRETGEVTNPNLLSDVADNFTINCYRNGCIPLMFSQSFSVPFFLLVCTSLLNVPHDELFPFHILILDLHELSRLKRSFKGGRYG